MKSQKMKSQNNISKLLGALFIIFALTFSTSSHAVDSNSSKSSKSSKSYKSSKSSKSSKKTDSVPIDGGLSILLLGAAAFGVKKLRDNKE